MSVRTTDASPFVALSPGYSTPAFAYKALTTADRRFLICLRLTVQHAAPQSDMAGSCSMSASRSTPSPTFALEMGLSSLHRVVSDEYDNAHEKSSRELALRIWQRVLTNVV
ncbi:hypothetical protein BKA80DRAFT_277524 [Phyllosticta citrichinensis]